MTFRLASLAQQAIEVNDDIFVEKVGLPIRALRVLRFIGDNPGTTFVDIAEVTAIERSQVSRIIQSLLSKELIKRQNSPIDARRFQLYITAKGEETRAIGRIVSDGLEEILLEPLSPTALAAFDRALAQLSQWLRSDEYLEKLTHYRENLSA